MLWLGYAALLVLALALGATLAWLVTGRALRQPRHYSMPGLDAQAALRRHPAGRALWADEDGPPTADAFSGPLGPDDDPDFIEHLERQIRGGHDPGQQG